MANFDVQIQDLIGTFSDQTAMDDFMTAGCKEIINALPNSMLYKCLDKSTLDNSTSTLVNVDTYGKIVTVVREESDSSGAVFRPCRYIPPHKRTVVKSDTVDMEYAKATDPAYTIYDNILEVFPTPTSAQVAEVQYVVFPTVDASGVSTIANFPNEAEHLVVLYASIKALQQLMTTKHSDTAINNALAYLTEAVLQARTAVEKFENADSESVFGDESTFLTNYSQLARVKDALDNAEKIIDDGANSPTGNSAGDAATYLYTDEDIELLNGAISIASIEINRAKTHLAEWTSIGDMRVKEINAALSEAQGYASEVQSRLAVDSAQYSWYEKQQAKLQADYDKGIQALQ